MLKAYKYRIYPTDEQKILLAKSFGCVRWFYNWALNLTCETYKATGKGISRNEIINLLPSLKREYECVHLIEIDLLRRGTRPFNHPRLPNVSYLVTLSRAQSGMVEVWPILLQDSLPIVPVPLRQPDRDIPLDLPTALNAIYDEAAYDLSIDYNQMPPPPAFSEADIEWMRSLIAQENLG